MRRWLRSNRGKPQTATPTELLVASLFLVAMPGAASSFWFQVAMPGAPSNFWFLVAMPGAPSSFLLLVAMPFAPSSVLVPSSDGLQPTCDGLHLIASLLLSISRFQLFKIEHASSHVVFKRSRRFSYICSLLSTVTLI